LGVHSDVRTAVRPPRCVVVGEASEQRNGERVWWWRRTSDTRCGGGDRHPPSRVTFCPNGLWTTNPSRSGRPSTSAVDWARRVGVQPDGSCQLEAADIESKSGDSVTPPPVFSPSAGAVSLTCRLAGWAARHVQGEEGHCSRVRSPYPLVPAARGASPACS
jgi:hypothetical protein